jgi:uncharacterized protein YjbJ (UPF0337 family)
VLALPRPGSGSLREIDEGSPVTDRIENKDDAKGRVKEAAGDLTGDRDLKREGKVDQAGGKAKESVERLTDKVKDVLRRDR